MMKKFHLGDILSITDGHLMSPNLMDGVYEILSYMSGERMTTLSISHTAKEAESYLFQQHPWLRDVIVPDDLNPNNFKAVMADLVAQWGEFHNVRPMHPEDHEIVDDMTAARRQGFKGEFFVVDDEDPLFPYGDIS